MKLRAAGYVALYVIRIAEKRLHETVRRKPRAALRIVYGAPLPVLVIILVGFGVVVQITVIHTARLFADIQFRFAHFKRPVERAHALNHPTDRGRTRENLHFPPLALRLKHFGIVAVHPRGDFTVFPLAGRREHARMPVAHGKNRIHALFDLHAERRQRIVRGRGGKNVVKLPVNILRRVVTRSVTAEMADVKRNVSLRSRCIGLRFETVGHRRTGAVLDRIEHLLADSLSVDRGSPCKQQDGKPRIAD